MASPLQYTWRWASQVTLTWCFGSLSCWNLQRRSYNLLAFSKRVVTKNFLISGGVQDPRKNLVTDMAAQRSLNETAAQRWTLTSSWPLELMNDHVFFILYFPRNGIHPRWSFIGKYDAAPYASRASYGHCTISSSLICGVQCASISSLAHPFIIHSKKSSSKSPVTLSSWNFSSHFHCSKEMVWFILDPSFRLGAKDTIFGLPERGLRSRGSLFPNFFCICKLLLCWN